MRYPKRSTQALAARRTAGGMTSNLSIESLFDALHGPLSLSWAAGRSAANTELSRDGNEAERPNLIGYFNPVSPNRIQIIGIAEFEALHKGTQKPSMGQSEGSNIIIYSDDLQPPQSSLALADSNHIALFCSPRPARELIAELRYYLAKRLAPSKIEHGVFLGVLGSGVLITGDAGTGKSEVALELISRGHSLVADDATLFTRTSPTTLVGSCPEVLENFLEVRGLGILNVQQMYGDAATRSKMVLHLIVHLQQFSADELQSFDRLEGQRRVRRVLGIEITEITIPVAPVAT
ncbi:HPr kinase/phosphorylase-like [Oratosquilla oratoria]|uniref:HPr kinase/phosphorylase-like n=1 Tax=Oratosquilla oratoria TaxID=337810 RepID=UPI003F75A0BE